MPSSASWLALPSRSGFGFRKELKLDLKEFAAEGKNLVVHKLPMSPQSGNFASKDSALLKSLFAVIYQEQEFTKSFQPESDSIFFEKNKTNPFPKKSVFLRFSSPEPSDQKVCRLLRKDTFPHYLLRFYFFLSSQRFLYYYRL